MTAGRFTVAQQRAIAARGNVLVVAGAGTGKTSTLVERCLRLVVEEPCALEEILMVTFTEAAAAQMRSRIRAALETLQESLADPAQAEHVRQQLALLEAAPIGTLHSFCLLLVRQHFFELGLDPAVMVLDEKQTAPLQAQALEAMFLRHYASDTLESVGVHELVRHLGRGSDEPIRALILRLHRYRQTLEDADGWLARQEVLFQQETPDAWRAWFLAGLDEWRTFWLPELEPHAGVPAVAAFHRVLKHLPASPDWAQAVAAFRELQAADAAPANWPRGTKTKTQKELRAFLNDLGFLCGTLLSDDGTDGLAQDWEWIRPHLYTLLRLTREFGAAFSRAKRELGGLDFADLEQYALRLLRDPATGAPTAAARQWQQRLRFVFVDEYQDINPAQDAILTALSREEREPNRFLVGDVKQSIYRFRLANPKIFCAYETLWRSDPQRGVRIPLADNFRSREPLLHFVNALFAPLMRASVGGLAYEADAHLRFGEAPGRAALTAAAAPGPCVELHLIDQADATAGTAGAEGDAAPAAPAEGLDLLAAEREARLVALRLRELQAAAHPVWDPAANRWRPMAWRDAVVLLRSPSSRVEAFAKEFHRLGVPLAAARSGFFRSLEVTDLLNALRLLDNPLQDLPLLAVLRSPLVGLSVDQLVAIRAHNREKPFWFALRAFHRAGPGAADGNLGLELDRNSGISKLQSSAWTILEVFLRQYDRWRNLARQSSLSHCLETMLTETQYEALLLAEPRGEERAANVRRLLAVAREYDPYQRQGLYRFLRFVDQQEEAEIEHEPAAAQTDDAVRLMSIHRAKGLEFPVVVLAGLGGLFNLRDLRQSFLLHETYGICPRIQPPDTDQTYPSLISWLARREEHRELMGEELRLLYVALTRARDTLILTGTGNDPRWSGDSPAAISDHDLLSARSYLDWLRQWLPHVTRPADWTNDRAGANALLRWSIYSANDARLLAPEAGPRAEVEPVVAPDGLDEVGLLKLKARLLWQYPAAAATTEPAIKRVSELVWAQPDGGGEEQSLFRETPAVALPRPAKARRRERDRDRRALAAVDVGNAHHRFLELVALDRVGSLDDLREEAEMMLEEGSLNRDEVQALDYAAILAFWRSAVAQEILACPRRAVHREIPFTARLSPDDLAPLGLCPNAAELAGEFFVARGVVDLAVILPEEIRVLDFKTDQLTPAEAEARLPHYARQLKLYGLALSRIYRRPVTRRWLHWLALRETVTV